MSDIIRWWWLSTVVPFMSLEDQSKIYTVEMAGIDDARAWVKKSLDDVKTARSFSSMQKINLWTGTAFIIAKWPKDGAAIMAMEVRTILFKKTKLSEGISALTKILGVFMFVMLIYSAIKHGGTRQDHRLKPI